MSSLSKCASLVFGVSERQLNAVRHRLGHPPKSLHCWAYRVAKKRARPVQRAPNFLLRPERSYCRYAKDWLTELLLRRSKPGKDFRGRFVVEAKFFGSVGALKCIGRQCFRDICLMLSLPSSARDAVIGPKLVHRDTEGSRGRYLEKLHWFGIRRAVKSPDMGQWPGAETHERS